MPLLLDDEVLPVARLARLSVALTFLESSPQHYPSQLFSLLSTWSTGWRNYLLLQ